MLFGNIKMAMDSLKASRWRSLLTMLGIIIGVLSVITVVSIGEGIKQQVVGQIHHLGPDLITVQPGKTISRDKNGNIKSVNLLASFGASSLTEADLNIAKDTDGVKVAVPLSPITGIAQTDTREYSGGLILGTTPGAPEILNQKVQYGVFFSDRDVNQDGVVIGQRVAEELFQENVPVGKELRIRGQTFLVRGVFEEFEANPLTPTIDFNSAIYVPYDVGKKLSGGTALVSQILVKPKNPKQTDQVAKNVRANLLKAHAGQEDFTVLQQQENLEIAGNLLNLLTGGIAAVAAISLIVGGIGIMNIMFVSVSERTHEIGVRKAIGATNMQILSQFLVEALILSFAGGVIGVVLSGLANYLLRILTNLTPIITLPVIMVSVGVSVLVGVIFGITPAMRAARKDPIVALRGI